MRITRAYIERHAGKKYRDWFRTLGIDVFDFAAMREKVIGMEGAKIPDDDDGDEVDEDTNAYVSVFRRYDIVLWALPDVDRDLYHKFCDERAQILDGDLPHEAMATARAVQSLEYYDRLAALDRVLDIEPDDESEASDEDDDEELDEDAVAAAMDLWNDRDAAEDAVRGGYDTFSSLAAYGETKAGDLGEISDAIRPYIDWAAYGDAALADDENAIERDGVVYVFR